MTRRVFFALFAGVVLLAMIWPGYAMFGARIEPYVLGLPFSLAWVVGWVLLTFAGLAVFHATGGEAG